MAEGAALTASQRCGGAPTLNRNRVWVGEWWGQEAGKTVELGHGQAGGSEEVWLVKGFCNFKILSGGQLWVISSGMEMNSIGSKEARGRQIIMFKNHWTPWGCWLRTLGQMLMSLSQVEKVPGSESGQFGCTRKNGSAIITDLQESGFYRRIFRMTFKISIGHYHEEAGFQNSRNSL